MHGSLSTPIRPHKNRSWVWNTSWPWDKEPTPPLLGFSPCVGISFPVSGSTCAPLFYLSLHQWPSGMAPAFNVSDSVREVGSSPSAAHRPITLCQLQGHPLAWGTNAHYWRWSCPVSLCKKALFHLVLVHAFLGDSNTKMQWTEVLTSIPSGWHCDDLCYPPHSWSPLLALVNGVVILYNLCELVTET